MQNKFFATAAAAVALAAGSLQAADVTFNGIAVTDAQDASGVSVPVGSVVYWLVDNTVGTPFDSLISNTVIDLVVGQSLSVGAQFAGFDIIATSNVSGADGFITSGINIPYGAGETAGLNDQFALVWFRDDPGATVDGTFDGLDFGFLTDSTWAFPSTDSPGAVIGFVDGAANPAEAEQFGVQQADKVINVVPEPAAGGLFGLVALLIARRRR